MLARRRARADAQAAVPHFVSDSRPVRAISISRKFFPCAAKMFARLRQQHAPAHAVDEPRAEVVLERLDCVADGGLREK